MVQKIGQEYQNLFQKDKVNNVDNDGLIILIQKLIKVNGQMMNNGFYFYFIILMEINGHKLLNICQVEQITVLKIIGIPQCERKCRYFNK
jgi:hypothetical protein